MERSGNKLLVIVKKMRLVLFQVVFDDFVLRRDIPSLKQSHWPFMGLSWAFQISQAAVVKKLKQSIDLNVLHIWR